MNRIVFSLFLLLALCARVLALDYVNPILPYDYSDPDVCRVGNTYVMTSSSFNNVPGLQILASRDLVHWEIVDAALRQALPGYRPGERPTGKYVWAPSIRVHNHMLYIYYGDPDSGIWCVRADIGRGLKWPLRWQEPVLVMPARGYIDPCPLWDEDGRCYLVHALAGSRAGLKSCLMMAELSADGLSVKVPSRIIFDGHEEQETCEGPKLYKRHGYYYIFHPAGGVRTGWQVVQRSRNIYGPYELKVVLAQGQSDVNGPHQGAWVEAKGGAHYFLHFQDVGVAGRIVHMQPMRWADDWPEMGNHGEPMACVGKVSEGAEYTWANFARRDEFDNAELALDWQFAGAHIDPKWYYCDAAHSRLRLYSFPQLSDGFMPNMLLQKIPAVAFSATARVRWNPNHNPRLKGGEDAGLMLFGRKSFTLPVPVEQEWVCLRVKVDQHQRCQFYTSSDGVHYEPYGAPFVAKEGHWTGAQVGLYCTRTDAGINDAGYLDIDWFEIELDRVSPFMHHLAASQMAHYPEMWRCDGVDKPKWEYTPTLMARAYLELYTLTGDTAYLAYARRFADMFVGEDGAILTYKESQYNLDRVQGGNFLILLNEIDPQPRYRQAIELLRHQFEGQPRTEEGGFWHKQVYAHQMWLDGLFTGTTFYARYARWANRTQDWADVARQFLVVDKHTVKPNGLNHHGWDESRQMGWSNPETGCSPETWGRAEGWYVMALVDVLEQMPATHPERAQLTAILQRVIDALMQVQDPKTGLWYQVPDKGSLKGNYLESTCSAMYCYAMAKGARLGLLDMEYRDEAMRVLNALIQHKIRRHEDGTISLIDCCAVAGLGGNPYRDGTYSYYIHERIREDDPKGVAPLLLACIELSK